MHLLQTAVSPGYKPLEKRIVAPIFVLRPHATACNLTLEGGTNIGVIAPLCNDSDPCAENELNYSKLEQLTHRGAMTPACAVTRTITLIQHFLPSSTHVDSYLPTLLGALSS